MSTQTEPKLVTQIDFARAGQITPQMKEVAEREHRDPEYIRERVADGRIAIPANIVHIKKGMRAFGVGEGLSTKVNVNLGISGDKADAAEEWKKVKIAEDFGADAIMDLSNSGKTRQFRQQLIDETPLMVGTVPMYDAIGYMEKPLVKLTKDDLFEVVRAHAEDGVDFMTIHCGINKSVTKTFKETGRLMNIVSRGGSLLFGWMEVTGNENPFYEFYDELLEICHEYDVTISLGDSCRPGCLYDSNDATETAEMIELGKLCKRAWAAGVQVMVEGPGHMALDEIAANMKLQKRLCHNAPFYVLGPLVTDIGVGYDHITAAIGGAISASSGADFLCYVTPAEHLCLPNAQDVLDGLMATKIAAHAADIAKKVPHARDMDDKMGQARRKLDWDAMWKCALDPVTGKKRYEESPAATEGTCTMCGKMCAVRTVNKIFEGTTIDLGIHGLHPELIRMIGKMKYRSSYGQNLLQHARETANLAGIMAAELGLNPKTARRAGLLHDIGKVPDDEPELPHAIIGMKLAEKYKEKPEVCNAIGAHHDEVEMTSLIAPIIQVCDAISGARPGARREVVESYIKRLKEMEDIALSYPGVVKTYAIQAGRELRVIVGADKLTDQESEGLSHDIAKKIQDEMTYPGQVKITVIRETRAVSYAK